jgi:hypothetical protein
LRRVDVVHFLLMGLALALAYAVPFELLVLSYAVLGPAHYTTEISWLHDRKYFLPHRAIAIVLILVGIVASFITDGNAFGFVIWALLAGCILLTGAVTTAQRIALLVVILGFTAFLWLRTPALIVVAVLLPTLIHVSLFTLVFMTLGAFKSKSPAQAGLVLAYLASVALILLAPPSAATAVPKFAQFARDYFGGVAPALGQVVGIPDLSFDARLMGLLGFVYSYHYLNWFIKADVIKWNAISRGRLIFIAAASAASTALYFYNYALGFSVLLAISLLHVVLEFPLNALAARQLLGTARADAARLWRARSVQPAE